MRVAIPCLNKLTKPAQAGSMASPRPGLVEAELAVDPAHHMAECPVRRDGRPGHREKTAAARCYLSRSLRRAFWPRIAEQPQERKPAPGVPQQAPSGEGHDVSEHQTVAPVPYPVLQRLLPSPQGQGPLVAPPSRSPMPPR